MNKLDVIISHVESSGGILLVDMEASDFALTALLIDTVHNPDWIFEGNHVYAVFKETEVSVAKNFSGLISLRNKIPCEIQTIEKGDLMSLIRMTCKSAAITSVITSRSVNALKLEPHDHVTAMIKANEVTLMQKC